MQYSGTPIWRYAKGAVKLYRSFETPDITIWLWSNGKNHYILVNLRELNGKGDKKYKVDKEA